MREQKRIRDEKKKIQRDQLTGGSQIGADGRQNISNAFIDKILNDEPLYPEADDSMN